MFRSQLDRGKHPGGRPKNKGKRCPCGIMLAETAKKRYHKCVGIPLASLVNAMDFTKRLRDLELRTRPKDYDLQHEGETK